MRDLMNWLRMISLVVAGLLAATVAVVLLTAIGAAIYLLGYIIAPVILIMALAAMIYGYMREGRK